MKRSMLSILALAAFASSGSGVARAGLINGSFEDPPLPSAGNYAEFGTTGGLPGWTIEAGNVDVVKSINSYTDWSGNVLPALTAPDGNNLLDLNGDQPGTLSQVMAATAGQLYQLTFAYSGYRDQQYPGSSLDDGIRVQLFDGNSNAILAQPADIFIQLPNLYNWTAVTVQVTATSSLLGVRFQSIFNGNDGYIGAVIDNVVLAPAASTVPEPPSCLLMAAAGAMLLAYRRRGR